MGAYASAGLLASVCENRVRWVVCSERRPPPPIPPQAPTTTLPNTSAPTTSTPALASAPPIGEPCNDWSKTARDPNTGLTIICDGATDRGAPAPDWSADDLSHVIGRPSAPRVQNPNPTQRRYRLMITSSRAFQPMRAAVSLPGLARQRCSVGPATAMADPPNRLRPER